VPEPLRNRPRHPAPVPAPRAILSVREQQARYIARGFTHQQAARRMGVSKTTVDTYVRRIRTGRVVRPGPAGPSGIGPASAVERP
jgi:DNA-binding NarL/FixJ family response regulator